MTVPTFFRGNEKTLTNFTFLDVLQGNGVLTLYGGNTDVGYALSSFTWASEGAGTWIGTIPSTAANVFDENFDVSINKQLVVSGKALVQVPWVFRPRGTGVTTGEATVTLIRVRGGSPTTIVTNTGTELSLTVANIGTTARTFVSTTELTVPLTIFKKGDTLRLQVEVKAGASGTGQAAQGYVGHDPINRTLDNVLVEASANQAATATDKTALKILLPVKIDL